MAKREQQQETPAPTTQQARAAADIPTAEQPSAQREPEQQPAVEVKAKKVRSTVTYEAEGMEDVADHLATLATEREERAAGSRYAHDRERSKAQAEGLREAERIVRHTTITGQLDSSGQPIP